MIQNERQYRITKANLEKFQAALETLEATRNLHPVARRAQQGAITSEIEVMRAELREFESLQDGQAFPLDVDAVLALPENLIRARIAAGLSHKDLAGRLGLKEQQIQRYESTAYRTASLERVMQIAAAISGRSAERAVKARKTASKTKRVSLTARSRA
jgi:ribosome-binding protein aMBF1 (putative translation factor)